MVEAHSLATNFYSHLLLNTVEGEKALEYLENRGFTRPISKNMESDGPLMNLMHLSTYSIVKVLI